MLYAGGAFTLTQFDRNLAYWNGTQWVGTGAIDNGIVRALAVFDDGSGAGPRLYVGGTFSSTGGVITDGLAIWNGSSWSVVDPWFDGSVSALFVYDDGSGPALFIGGSFTLVPDGPFYRFAKWDGKTWHTLADNDEGFGAFCVFDDGAGQGPALFGLGSYVTAQDELANNIGKWNGDSWTVIAEMIEFEATCLAPIAVDNKLPTLIVGGAFENSPAHDAYIAMWRGSEALLPGDLNSDGVVDEADRTVLCSALGSSFGDRSFTSLADFNDDGVIDHLDQATLNALLPVCVGDIVDSDTFVPPGDGLIDGADLAILLGDWGTHPSCADLVTSKTFLPPPDGKVDGADLAVLLGAWGDCE